MGHQRKPSAHQKQIRFFTILVGAILIALVAGLLWMLNRITTPHP
jgi:membrane protein DedA with SNARE-associated domain